MKQIQTQKNCGTKRDVSGFILRTFKNACVVFTVLAAAILLFNIIYSSGIDNNGNYVSTASFLFFLLPFSLLVSVAHSLLSLNKLGIYRWFAHIFLCNGGFYLCLLLPYKIKMSAKSTSVLFLMLIFMLIYALVTVVGAIITDRNKKVASDKSEYVGMFSKKQ